MVAMEAIAFLRVYDETDFLFLGYFANARLGRNRLTVAARPVALVNFGVVERSSREAWDRRNRKTDRRAEEAERAARRARIQNRWIVLQARYLLSPREGLTHQAVAPNGGSVCCPEAYGAVFVKTI